MAVFQRARFSATDFCQDGKRIVSRKVAETRRKKRGGEFSGQNNSASLREIADEFAFDLYLQPHLAPEMIKPLENTSIFFHEVE